MGLLTNINKHQYSINSHLGAVTETTSEPTSGVPVAEHEYAETEINVQQSKPPESEQQSMASYTNTTPGVITQEAVNHYDMGQWSDMKLKTAYSERY